jgi:hypothetical protein
MVHYSDVMAGAMMRSRFGDRHMSPRTAAALRPRMKPEELERLIARQIVEDAIAAGYEIDVNDGEETTLQYSTNRDDVLAAMFSTDCDQLTLYTGAGSLADLGIVDKRRRVGSIFLIWGNGHDVVSDYSDNLEIASVLGRANATAEEAG